MEKVEEVQLTESTAGVTLSQFSILVAAGAFATTIAQVKLVGRLPLQVLLKNHFHFDATQIATFMAIAVFAWNLKPFAGIFTDAFPIFRPRRRHYMLISALAGTICWLVMGLVYGNYSVLLGSAVALKRDAQRKPRKDDPEARHKAEIDRMRAVIAEITAENLELKKTLSG